MHEVENPTGRLLTFRMHPPASDEQSERATAQLRAFVIASKMPVLAVTDTRRVRAFSPATAERLVAMMRADNPKVDRSAVLIDAGAATLVLQVKRMLSEAAGTRRAFLDARALVAWVSAGMTAEEKAALDTFVSAPL